MYNIFTLHMHGHILTNHKVFIHFKSYQIMFSDHEKHEVFFKDLRYLVFTEDSPALQTCIISNPIFSPSLSQSVQITRYWAPLTSRSSVR